MMYMLATTAYIIPIGQLRFQVRGVRSSRESEGWGILGHLLHLPPAFLVSFLLSVYAAQKILDACSIKERIHFTLKPGILLLLLNCLQESQPSLLI